MRAGLGAGAAGGPKEKKVPTWEVVLGQTGRLGNYTAGTTWVPGSLGKAGRQAGRYVICSTAWQAHNNDAGLARPSCLQHLHVHAPVVVLFECALTGQLAATDTCDLGPGSLGTVV